MQMFVRMEKTRKKYMEFIFNFGGDLFYNLLIFFPLKQYKYTCVLNGAPWHINVKFSILFVGITNQSNV